MKSKNLIILRENGINVPKFVIVKSEKEVTPTLLFTLSNDKKYAVRSSFDGEDSNNNSFAGQFDTLLNVKKSNLENAVKQVRDSYKKTNVVEYSNLKNAHSKNACVIIQEMIDAEYSGVIFTANPLGILNETVVVVGAGLGNNVVEDKINTTSYFYNQDDKNYCYEQNEDSPLLPDRILMELIGISEKIEKIFDKKMDIEFAVANDVVYILQARPITTLCIENPIILDNSNIVESYPGISLPLTQDFVKSVYYGVFKSCVSRITKNQKLIDGIDKDLRQMTDVANWRIYYRISNWYSVLKLLPFSKKIIPVWQNMLGVSNLTVPEAEFKVPLKTKFTVFCSFWYYLNKIPRLMDELNANFSENFHQYEMRVEHANTIADLLAVYESIKNDILCDWDLTLINDMYTFINTGLAGKKNRQKIADIKNLESMKPVIAIQELVNNARIYGIDSDKYITDANKYIELYGDRCLEELKLETKTYRTNPELLDEYVLNSLKQSQFELSHDSGEQKDSFFVKRAKLGIKNREISRLNRSRIYGLSRSIFLKIGDMLVERGFIDVNTDVFYLHIKETRYHQNLRDIVNKRKQEEIFFKELPVANRLVFANKVFDKTNCVKNGKKNINKSELVGIASSSGQVVGEVLIIEEPDENTDTTDKILVTKTTDPGWVFLIKNAKGIIAEKGSLLSHTAIISRELHKPAVVNVKDCTSILKNGDLVELNADEGVIKILRSSEDE